MTMRIVRTDQPTSVVLAHQDAIEALHREIERLPARYNTAVVLCDLQGLTHEEAARRLGRRVGTISSQVSRAENGCAAGSIAAGWPTRAELSLPRSIRQGPRCSRTRS